MFQLGEIETVLFLQQRKVLTMTLSSPCKDDFPNVINIVGLFVITGTKATLRKVFPKENLNKSLDKLQYSS